MNAMNKTALTIAIIGALNWLLVGIFSFDLVAFLFGAGSILSRVIYTVVGLAGIWCISLLFKPHEEHHRDELHHSHHA